MIDSMDLRKEQEGGGGGGAPLREQGARIIATAFLGVSSDETAGSVTSRAYAAFDAVARLLAERPPAAPPVRGEWRDLLRVAGSELELAAEALEGLGSSYAAENKRKVAGRIARALADAPAAPPLPIATPEELGRTVREEWVRKAREHPDPKPSWLVPWEELGQWDRDIDVLIGEAVCRLLLTRRNPYGRGDGICPQCGALSAPSPESAPEPPKRSRNGVEHLRQIADDIIEGRGHSLTPGDALCVRTASNLIAASAPPPEEE